MEDRFCVSKANNDNIFSLFDGHYGSRAAYYASVHLNETIKNRPEFMKSDYPAALLEGYLELDQKLLEASRIENWHDGTTSLTALTGEVLNKKQTRKATRLFIANSGDCRAIASYVDGKIYRLTQDHNPSLPSERCRIKKAGGKIKFGRIDGKLSVSRGFGDRQFKEPKKIVDATPDILSIKIDSDLKVVVMACDGVWGWLSDLQVSKFVCKSLKQGSKLETTAYDLVRYAYDSGSTDNISVLILHFVPMYKRESSNFKWKYDQYIVETPSLINQYIRIHTQGTDFFPLLDYDSDSSDCSDNLELLRDLRLSADQFQASGGDSKARKRSGLTIDTSPEKQRFGSLPKSVFDKEDLVPSFRVDPGRIKFGSLNYPKDEKYKCIKYPKSDDETTYSSYPKGYDDDDDQKYLKSGQEILKYPKSDDEKVSKHFKNSEKISRYSKSKKDVSAYRTYTDKVSTEKPPRGIKNDKEKAIPVIPLKNQSDAECPRQVSSSSGLKSKDLDQCSYSPKSDSGLVSKRLKKVKPKK